MDDQRSFKCCLRHMLCIIAVLLSQRCDIAPAQDASLLLVPPPAPKQKAALTLENSSFMYRRLPPEAEQRELQLHDTIKVIVDYKSALTSDGDANSKKTANFSAVLSDWLKFTGKDIVPAPMKNGDPKVNGSLTSQ